MASSADMVRIRTFVFGSEILGRFSIVGNSDSTGLMKSAEEGDDLVGSNSLRLRDRRSAELGKRGKLGISCNFGAVPCEMVSMEPMICLKITGKLGPFATACDIASASPEVYNFELGSNFPGINTVFQIGPLSESNLVLAKMSSVIASMLLISWSRTENPKFVRLSVVSKYFVGYDRDSVTLARSRGWRYETISKARRRDSSLMGTLDLSGVKRNENAIPVLWYS